YWTTRFGPGSWCRCHRECGPWSLGCSQPANRRHTAPVHCPRVSGVWLPLARALANLCAVGLSWTRDVTVLGGCGPVGLPLGLAFAGSGQRVTLYDTNLAAVDRVRSGKMPHLEPGAPEVLVRTLDNGTLAASADPSAIGASEHLVVVIGTPVDEHLNPDPQAVVLAIEEVT